MSSINAINTALHNTSVNKELAAQPIKPQVSFGRRGCEGCDNGGANGVTLLSFLLVGGALGALALSVIKGNGAKSKEAAKEFSESLYKDLNIKDKDIKTLIVKAQEASIATIKKIVSLGKEGAKDLKDEMAVLYSEMIEVTKNGKPTAKAKAAAEKFCNKVSEFWTSIASK